MIPKILLVKGVAAMIHKATVLTTFPGTLWAQEKQAQRIRMAYDPTNKKLVKFEDRFVNSGIVFCEKGTIKVWASSGKEIDVTSELEYEFVQYDEHRKLIILAVMTGDGEAGARFDAIFTKLKASDIYLENRAFLIIPVAKSIRVTATALMPSGDDTHNDYGVTASSDYLSQLLRASGR
jgi:hypothetical protein